MTTTTVSSERAKELLELIQQGVDQKGDWREALEQAMYIAQDLVNESTPEERVIFRKFPHNGEVIALFPDQYNERNGKIMSYAHKGQHCETYPDFGDTKATDEWSDYGDLYRELANQGYTKLKIVKRFGKLGRK